MAPGKKRTSPGAEASKNGTIDNEVGLSEEDAKRLSDIGKEITHAELVLGASYNPPLVVLDAESTFSFM